jgi:phosphatidylethanolamine-binding protein (PEBP) family uncharacterized protein
MTPSWYRARVYQIVTIAVAFIVIWSHPVMAMSVKFSWAGHPSCSSSSPAFTVSDVPEGTVHLTFKMIDKNVPNYPHGGGTIAYEGKNEIPSGAFAYTGPCPPAGQQHAYKWTVRALDANGKELASAVAVGKFPPR